MGFLDFFIAPFYLVVFLIIASSIKKKYYSNHPLAKYYLPGLYVKLLGGIATAFIYDFYYRGGDALNYFDSVTVLIDGLSQNPFTYIKALFLGAGTTDPQVSSLFAGHWMLGDNATLVVAKIVSLIAIFSFNKFLVISMFLGFLSFFAVWKLLLVFYDLYPSIHKQLAFSILFVPSVFFWGSGLFKDTITFACLCLLTYYSYQLFIKGTDKKLMAVAILLINAYLLATIKAYIIMAITPPLIFWVILNYQARFSNKLLQIVVFPLFLVIAAGLGLFLVQQAGNVSKSYSSINDITEKAYDTQWWHYKVNQLYGDRGGGSYYSLGKPDPSLTGMFSKIPAAVNVTLYRPYLWEADNIVMLFAALESTLILLFTLKVVLIGAGIFKVIKYFTTRPVLFFTLSFAVLFAFGVGFTSYNFGALVRYKIPCIPFYLAGLFMIQEEARQESGQSTKKQKGYIASENSK